MIYVIPWRWYVQSDVKRNSVNNNNNNNNNNISSVNKNQIYSTYPMFIFVKLAFGRHCLNVQVYAINSMILKKRLQDILIFH